MPRDELREPLRKRSLRQRLWAKRPRLFTVAAVCLAMAFTAGGTWLLLTPRPLAGEPVVVAVIPPVQELVTASIGKAAEEPPLEGQEEATEDVIDQSAAEIRVFDGESAGEAEPSGGREDVSIISPRRRPMPPAPIAEVSEETETGPLPQVSAHGLKPFNAYSQSSSLSVTASKQPKIALVLGGMGLNPELTEMALEDLPGQVTLGFAPYGENLQDQVNAARARS